MSIRSRRVVPVGRRGRPTQPSWRGFLAWAALGAVVALASLSIQIFSGIVALVAVLVAPSAARRSAFGLLAGAGAVSLYVAFVNRKGPGLVTWHTATTAGGDVYLDPKPWLAAGIVLVVAGVLGQSWLNRRSA